MPQDFGTLKLFVEGEDQQDGSHTITMEMESDSPDIAERVVRLVVKRFMDSKRNVDQHGAPPGWRPNAVGNVCTHEGRTQATIVIVGIPKAIGPVIAELLKHLAELTIFQCTMDPKTGATR